MNPIDFKFKDPFHQTKNIFLKLLVLKTQDHLPKLIQDFKSSLLDLEQLPPEILALACQKHHQLFIEIFQFERLSVSEIWDESPLLYQQIGRCITCERAHENLFRSKVHREQLGPLLKFLE